MTDRGNPSSAEPLTTMPSMPPGPADRLYGIDSTHQTTGNTVQVRHKRSLQDLQRVIALAREEQGCGVRVEITETMVNYTIDHDLPPGQLHYHVKLRLP